jgi:hypothetical protein
MTRARNQVERGYHVLPLNEIIRAPGKGAALAARTVVREQPASAAMASMCRMQTPTR